MNKAIALLRKGVFSVLAVAAAGVLFTACLKNKDDNNTVPAAGLMTFNLAPDQQSVVVTLNGNILTQSPLAYTNYTGVYQPVYIGSRTINSYNYYNNTALATSNYTFDQNKYYSVFVVGKDSSYRNVVSVDNFDSLSATAGKAYVRYINAITDSVNLPAVTVTAGSDNVVSENAAYAAVSEFKAVTPGAVNITVKNNNGVEASRSITVEQNKVYTILLIGKPGATDETQKVQVKFVSNGTITDDSSK